MDKHKFISKINPLFLRGIAHRGLHDENKTENSLAAFKAAVENGFAIELDVHLTKDNQLMVMHDPDLVRTTGKEGIIEELTVQEVKDNYQLLNGEKVPTFKEVLELVNEQVPIVVELKVENKNYKPLAKRVLEEIKVIKDKRNIIFISFDPRGLAGVKHHGFVTSLLVTKTHEPSYEWIYNLRGLFDSVDLEKCMLTQKRVIRYHKKHFVNCWTIETEEELKDALYKSDTVTFQHIKPEVVKKAFIEKYGKL